MNETTASTQPVAAEPPASKLADKSFVGSRYASYVLIVLTIVYVFNFVDRQIISILAEDIKAGDAVLIKKGTPAFATVTEAYKSGKGGAPGNVVFVVNSLVVDGKTVKLRGSQALEGEVKLPNATTLIPVVGVFNILRHGKEAEIKPGTALTAYVDADTLLASAKDVTSPVN